MGEERPGTAKGLEHERPGEFDLIRTYFAPLASDPGSLGLTDDASVYHPRPGYELVLTKDMLAANVHFFSDDPPEAIAAKALRVNLSDLAAKGAVPRAYLLGLGLSDDWTAQWLERFACGLSGDQAAFDVTLVGGDTIRSGSGLQISITAIGEVPDGTAVRRSGGAAGHVLYVSGTLGDAAAGLKERLDPGFLNNLGLTDDDQKHLLHRYLLPQPRVALTGSIRSFASASMDISDGIFADARHLAKASGVDLEIEIGALPLSPALRKIQGADKDLAMVCLGGGDDYEILCLVPSDATEAFEASAADASIAVSRVGTAVAGEGAVRLLQDGQPLGVGQLHGFRHF
ncbi:thiamine-phosphate kinase [Roseibium limicola]|uniref:thiamine-phosphate kinase n=1 Tax=Roseibium limicola TaxID=2816037 RepID=UPI001AD8F703|nr:thiamine-phosphate kinase [Roseibium limicola]